MFYFQFQFLIFLDFVLNLQLKQILVSVLLKIFIFLTYKLIISAAGFIKILIHANKSSKGQKIDFTTLAILQNRDSLIFSHVGEHENFDFFFQRKIQFI